MENDHAGAVGEGYAHPRPGRAAQGTADEQFQRAVEDAPIPMIMQAEDGQVLQISRSWTELTGYTLSDVPTFDAWLNRAYGPGAKAVREHMHDLFAGNRRTLDVTFAIRTRVGTVRHWSLSASSPGTLRDGRRFIVGMAVDITERTRVEQALAEQARLLDLSNDAIIVRDITNRIIYWNRGAVELYGWSRDEAVGQDLHTLLRTEFEIPFEELIATLHHHDRMEGEVVQVTKDGQQITAWCRWALDRDIEGRPGAILTTYNDITERKRTEQQQAFLLTLSDALRAEPDADTVAYRALQLLSEHLQLDRCAIGVYRLADNRGDFTHQVGNDRVPPLPDVLRRFNIPAALRGAFGRTLVINDIATAEGLSDTDRHNLGALGLRALVAVTLRMGEHAPLWSIVAVSASPRQWTRGEIALVEAVTERTWEAVQRARAEAALHASQAELQKALSIDTVGVLFFHLDGRITDANAAFLTMSGYRREELLAMTDWVCLTPAEFRGVTAMATHALAETGETVPYEKQLIRKDGSRWWGLFAPTRLSGSGATSACVEFIIDITDSKRVQEALRESEARFRTLANAVPQVIWTNDGMGYATYFNQRWYDYSGLSQEESIGPGWQAIVHPDDAPASVERWQRALAAGAVFDTEYRLRRSDGVYRWHLGRNVPLRDDGDQVVGWFGSATDIEDLKQAERALHQARAELELRVQERTAELEQLSKSRQELLQRLVSSQEDERRRDNACLGNGGIYPFAKPNRTPVLNNITRTGVNS